MTIRRLGLTAIGCFCLGGCGVAADALLALPAGEDSVSSRLSLRLLAKLFRERCCLEAAEFDVLSPEESELLSLLTVNMTWFSGTSSGLMMNRLGGVNIFPHASIPCHGK